MWSRLFLHEINKIGWNVSGIEPSEEHFLYAINNLDLNVHKGMFHEYEEKNKFDLIYFSHVFDDLPNLDKTFEKINSLLKSNGRVFIEVPNHNRDKNFKLVKQGDFIENQYYFTTESVRKVFYDHGYHVEYLETYESIYLNSILQYFLAPYELIKRYIIPDVKKEQIRLIAVKK
jgi:SAM-dependent methyltransferase